MISQADFVHYLISDWGYPGVSAVLREDADVLLPYVELYEMGQEKNLGTPADTPTEELQALNWAPAENVTADDLSRDEILSGAFGGNG